MGYTDVIWSASIANVNGDGPWVDVGQIGPNWTIQIINAGNFTVEVSNQINQPYSYTGQNPLIFIPQYPPNKPPLNITTFVNESHVVPSNGQVTVSNPPSSVQSLVDGGAFFASGNGAGLRLISVPTPGSEGQYAVNPNTGVYTFNTYAFNGEGTDIGATVLLNYSIVSAAVGIVVPASTYIITSGSQSLVMSKSDLDVKWVRVRQASGGPLAGSPPVVSTVAFLHRSHL